MQYFFEGNQKYKQTKITTEMDALNASYIGLLTHKFPDTNRILVNGYTKNCIFNDGKLFNALKNNVFVAGGMNKIRFKSKEGELHSLDSNLTMNSLPFEFFLANIISEQDFTITKLKDESAATLHTLTNAYKKLGIQVKQEDDQVIIQPNKVSVKKQVESDGNPYIVKALSYLALFSEAPIVIRNAESIYSIDTNFFDYLKKLGAVVELIYD